MFPVRGFAWILLLLVLHLPALAQAGKKSSHHNPSPKKLESAIQEILADSELARGFWGISVVSLDSGQTLYQLNQDKLFTPASLTKLFTTAAVFGLVGGDYRFKTTVETSATLDKYGRLSGDLVLVGRGDPNLSGRTLPYNLHTERKAPPIQVLQQLADQLVQHGVKYVDGDVVADDSYYVFQRYGEGWSQDDLEMEWGAPVSALTINDNVMFVNIMPGDRPGERAFLSIVPFPDYYRIENRVMTIPKGAGPRVIYRHREPGSNEISFWGNIPVDDPGAGEALAIEDPADFAAKVFRQLLEERGVTVYGRPKTRHTELASMQTFAVTSLASGGGQESPPSASPLILASYESQPVAEDLQVINKVSQNLHAELMLRLLGKEKGTSGSIQSGLEVMWGFLTTVGIKPEEFAFYDGSGLSRENLISPAAVVKLLQYCHQQPWGQAYEDTLPVAGIDGSLTDRFRNTAARGLVHAKTGSLTHVYGLAGYATSIGGNHLVFSIIANNQTVPAKKIHDAIDRVVETLVDQP